jgi:hypothetical protein
LVKSLTFSLTSSLKRLAGFARCSVERISVPQRLETIEDGAFEDCSFLAAVDFSSCTNHCVVNRGEERIDGDVLVDDRAPAFDTANGRRGLAYSPGLYASLRAVAERSGAGTRWA